jgi:hypothetical protein
MALAVVLFSCDKQALTDSTSLLDINVKVKTATYDTTVFSYTYDAQGRQLTCDNSDGLKRKYDYPIGSIKESVYKNGTLEYFYKNDLNADGLCIKETKSNEPAYEQQYEYNPDKMMSKIITKKNGAAIQQIDFFYSNGNCDSIRLISNGQYSLTIVKEYYTDKPNVFSNEIFGNNHYGKSSRNMLRSETYIYPGSSGSCTNFSYEYDSQGRVAKEISSKANLTSISAYTYY